MPVAHGDCEAWPYLDKGVLRPSRSRKVCMTCHWFRHHAGAECIPLLTCQLHQGLIGQGEHLIRRCQGWTDDMARQRGWAPEAQVAVTAKANKTMCNRHGEM